MLQVDVKCPLLLLLLLLSSSSTTTTSLDYLRTLDAPEYLSATSQYIRFRDNVSHNVYQFHALSLSPGKSRLPENKMQRFKQQATGWTVRGS
jgi:hypothetical protein